MNNNGIIKFPDRERGFIWKKRDESGKWVEVNEDGTPVSQEASPQKPQEDLESPPDSPSLPMKERRVKKRKKAKMPGLVTGIRFSREMLEDLDDFIIWKNYTGRVHRTRADIIEEALELLMKKNTGFAEYRKKRDP